MLHDEIQASLGTHFYIWRFDKPFDKSVAETQTVTLNEVEFAQRYDNNLYEQTKPFYSYDPADPMFVQSTDLKKFGYLFVNDKGEYRVVPPREVVGDASQLGQKMLDDANAKAQAQAEHEARQAQRETAVKQAQERVNKVSINIAKVIERSLGAEASGRASTNLRGEPMLNAQGVYTSEVMGTVTLDVKDFQRLMDIIINQ